MTLTALSLSLAVLLGCPPAADLEETGDTEEADADTDADADADADSDADSDSDADADPEHTMAIATTTDYSVGALTTFALDSRNATDVADIASDAWVTVDQGKVLQLGRYGFDYLRIYDIGDWSNPQEISLAEGSNPQAAYFCDDKIFVSQYGVDKVAIFSAEGNPAGAIDLSAYADADGLPEAAAMIKDGDRLILALQILDQETFASAGPGQVLEIDCATEAIVGSHEVGVNPRISAHPQDSDVVFVQTGMYGSPDGDLRTLSLSEGLLSEPIVTESDVSGDIGGMVMNDAGKALMTVYTPSYGTEIYCLDADAETMTQLGGELPYSSGPWLNNKGEAWISVGYDWTNSVAGGAMLVDINSCSDLTAEGGYISSTLGISSMAFY
ncbi:MAG: hypothetical protein VX899_09790 [Myxococcota bacterium]|nr:hypothetical protein [Myxococcota bacterium]